MPPRRAATPNPELASALKTLRNHGKPSDSIRNLMEVEEDREKMLGKAEPPEPPKTIWVRDFKGYLSELAPDTPVRLRDGSMLALKDSPLHVEMDIHNHTWIHGERIADPKKVQILVEVTTIEQDPRVVLEHVRKLINRRDIGDRPDVAHTITLRLTGDS